MAGGTAGGCRRNNSAVSAVLKLGGTMTQKSKLLVWSVARNVSDLRTNLNRPVEKKV